MVLIGTSGYLDFLSKFGIGGAHPGGITLTKKIFEPEKINSTTHILDVGCGTGQTAAFLSSQYGAKVTGLDVNPIMIEKAKERMTKHRLPVKIIQASIEQCPLQESSFDFILSESVLLFVDKPKALREVFRLLKIGGKLIANELTLRKQLPTANQEEIKQFYGINTLLTEKDWAELFLQSGFKNLMIRNETNSINQVQSLPEIQFSDTIEPELYGVFYQHLMIMAKYQQTFDYGIFSCTK